MPALTGLVLGLALPRGPVTTAGALGAMAAGALAGLATGAAARSRWPLLAAPLALLAGFEAARVSARRPTVDLPDFGTSYAPEKRLVRFEDAGHAPAFEDFRRLERLLVDEVLPATYDVNRKGASP